MNKNLPHLLPGLLAILLLAGLIGGGSLYARALEARYVEALAPLELLQNSLGSAVQEAAFAQPDLLPVYGSSELVMGGGPYTASQYFSTYPTGFTVIEFARAGVSALTMAQEIAAIGPAIKGKKVVISFTPYAFDYREISQTNYAGNFSRLHAYALVFSPDIKMEIKRQAALRMLEYQDTYKNDPLLKFGLENLARNSRRNWILYELAMPFGRLETWIIRLQDHWEILNYIWSHPDLKPVMPHQPATINWQAEIARAEVEQKALSTNNPYGINNKEWTKLLKTKEFSTPVAPGSGDAVFVRNLNRALEWNDLQVLFAILKQYGARPLIISRPLNGPVLNATGISWDAHKAYYKKLEKFVESYGFPVVDFKEQDSDPYFSTDLFSHTSRKGWIYVNQTLDAFYHGHLH